MVAESTEIFFPIDQLGCLIACFGVILVRSSVLIFKKGPPEAVRINFETFEDFLHPKLEKLHYAQNQLEE